MEAAQSSIAAARTFATANRSTLMNVAYVIVALVVVFYLYKFLIAASDLDLTLLNVEVPANKPMALPLPPKHPDLRVKQGGEYTISFWMYITSWDYRSGLPTSVLQIVDANLGNSSLLTTILYPNENKMMVRVHTEKNSAAAASDTDYTLNSNFDALLSGSSSAGMNAPSTIASPMCDIQDIDLQRWINFTISVNGRIVDVYYDGKLTRSCVLPDIPSAPTTGQQSVIIGQKGGFGGKMSGVQFFGYPLTPDRIYAIYQAGPSSSSGFLGYLGEKLGIKMTYSGVGDVIKTASV